MVKNYLNTIILLIQLKEKKKKNMYGLNIVEKREKSM